MSQRYETYRNFFFSILFPSTLERSIDRPYPLCHASVIPRCLLVFCPPCRRPWDRRRVSRDARKRIADITWGHVGCFGEDHALICIVIGETEEYNLSCARRRGQWCKLTTHVDRQHPGGDRLHLHQHSYCSYCS